MQSSAPPPRIVISGSPGSGKSTVADELAARLEMPLLSLDVIKEALADVLGLGGEDWSDKVGDAAAEVVFRLAPTFPAVIAEGWWRRDRRTRAIAVFEGWAEVFCHCDPDLVEERVTMRAAADRHPIHRDVINPAVIAAAREAARTATPLELGGRLVDLDTTNGLDAAALAASLATGGSPTVS